MIDHERNLDEEERQHEEFMSEREALLHGAHCLLNALIAHGFLDAYIPGVGEEEISVVYTDAFGDQKRVKFLQDDPHWTDPTDWGHAPPLPPEERA